MKSMMNIELDLSDILNDEGQLNDQAAEEILRQCSARITEEYRKKSKDELREIAPRVITEMISGIVKEKLLSTIQLTNCYGEPTGKEMTLTEMIVKVTKEYMSERVNCDGGSGGYSSREAMSRAEYLVKTATKVQVKEVIDTYIKGQAKEIREGLLTEIRTSLGRVLGEKAETVINKMGTL
jgi:hypothetical protein